jgi:glycogen(starch) synthase
VLAAKRGWGLQDSASEGSAQKQSLPVAIIGVFPPPVGGQAIYNQTLLAELKRRGWDAVGIDCSSSAPTDDTPIRSAPTRKDLIRVLRHGDFCLYHLTASDTRFLGFEIIVAVLSLLKRVPLVVTVLAGQFGHRAAEYSRVHRYLLGTALRRATRILVSNSNQRQALHMLPLLSGAPVDTIGCSLPLAESSAHDPALATFLQAGNPAIVAVGAMREVYGFPLLVEACAALHQQGFTPRLLLAVSGEDDADAWAAFKDSIQTTEGSVEVRLERELPHAVCLGCIESADIFARPTLADGDSVSVHEALQLGTPVVASNASPRPAGVILHESGDTAALAASIAQTYRNHARSPERSLGNTTSFDEILRCYRSVLCSG